MENRDRKIVYWGAGFIGKCCLEYHPELNVAFFVDSNNGKSVIHGKEIKQPEQIKNWKNYFVIITVKNIEAVEQISDYLMKMELIPDEDFCTYEKYFQCTQPLVKESIEYIQAYMENTPDVSGSTVIIANALRIRNSKGFVNFATAYAKARRPQKCLFLANWLVVNPKEVSQKLSSQAIFLPDFHGAVSAALSVEEKRWLEELKQRKKDGYSKEIDEQIQNMLVYYNSIIRILQPQKIVFWGNWSLESYIVKYVAQKNGIASGYIEHGWLPGTYQIDPRGIMGQGELAVHPNLIKELEVKDIYNIREIKDYIIKEKLDTRIFHETTEDKESVQKLKKGHKTVFLVGMDDYGMQMNPKNEYWKRYISSNVESTEDALRQLMPVCRKKEWNLFFKPHPDNPVSEWVKESEELILVRDMEIDRLIQLADVVVSIASAVDFKTLIYGKPLVQLGINALRGAECTYCVERMEQLEDMLEVAMEQGMTKEQVGKFDYLLQLLLQYYLWDDLTERQLRYGLPVERDFYER